MEHSMPVWIDTEDRVGTCSVPGQGRAPVIDAYIDDSASGVCVNVGLEYPAKDKCGKPLAVKLKLYSNELKDFKPVDADVAKKTPALHNAGIFNRLNTLGARRAPNVAVKDHVVVERVNKQACPFTHNRDQSERKETADGHLEDSESAPRFLELSFEKEKGSRRFVSTGYKRNKHNRT